MMKWTVSLLGPLVIVISQAQAGSSLSLKEIHYRESGVISLEFTKTLPSDALEVSYINDFIQLTFSKATIPKAKVLTIESTPVKKIFAYQYSPGVLRTRIYLDQPSEGFKKKLKLEMAQNRVEVSLPPSVTESEAKASLEDALKAEKGEEVALVNDAPKVSEEEIPLEEALFQKSDKAQAGVGSTASSSQLGQASSTPSLKSMAEKLAWIVLGFVLLNAAIHLLRRFMKKRSSSEGGLLKNMGRFAKRNLGMKDGMIEIVSTHYLDPKNKIAVVKVAGRLLVLGITQDSMSLITQISHPTQKIEEQVEDEIISETALASSQNFSALFEKEKQKEIEPVSPRSRIKSRLEGLKPL